MMRPFEAGKPIASQLTATRLNEIQNSIPDIRFSTKGIRVSKMGKQTFVELVRQKGIGAAIESTPFFVTTRANPDDPTLYQAKVDLQSDLLLSLRPDDNLSITGLDSWFNFIANDVIALYVVVLDYVATSATIQSYGAGTTVFNPTLPAWQPTDDSYVFDDADPDNPKQIGINVLIAYSTPDADGNPFLIQSCSSHLLMQNVVIDGKAAIFPFPSTYRRYGITI